MKPSPTIWGAVAALLAIVSTGSASAQTASFKCPTVGTQFTARAGDVEATETAAGQDGNVCLLTSSVGGQTRTARIHWGLVGSVDAYGEEFAKGLDLKSLWPLKVGNKITNTVTVARDGKNVTTIITMTVAAYEKVTVPAGVFDTFRVEESKEGEIAARSIRWWAPALAHSVRATYPDWRDLSQNVNLELTKVTPAR